MAKLTNKHPVPAIGGNEEAVALAFAAFFRNALVEQKKKVLAGLENACVAFAESPSKVKAKAKQSNVVFNLAGFVLDGDPQKTLKIKGALKDVDVASAIAFWIAAIAKSDLAREAVDCGNFNSALTYFAEVERSIGAANSLLSNKGVVSFLAREKARASHASTYAMERAVVAYWKRNIDQSLSAPKAADQMLGLPQFRWEDGEEISHKFLAECVRSERKRRAKK